MHKNIKKVLICFLAVAMIMPFAYETYSATNDQTSENQEVSNETDEESKSEDEYAIRTEKETLDTMQLISENKNLMFYVSEEEDLMALKNKENGYVWWSSPINAEADKIATGSVKNDLKSSLTMIYGEPAKRTTTNLRSSRNAKRVQKQIENGIKITYRFNSADIIIPVEYVLHENYLSAKIITSEIKEETKETSESKIITQISVLPNMASASNEEDGYYIIPDGSGAIINFNNGKINSKSYNSKIYGSDITMVPNFKPAVTKQIYLPLYATVKGENGLLSVIEKGDANAEINSNVSMLSKSSYNSCNFSFILRGTDTFYMGSDANPLTVFEKGDITTPEIEIKMFPIEKENMQFTDVAEKYRNYLLQTGKINIKDNLKDTNVYLDLYGGVEKTEPFLGVPVIKKKAITTFEEAQKIISELVDLGVDNMVVTMDNWTTEGIENKVDNRAVPSSVLGGKSSFTKMKKYLDEKNIMFYPIVNNKTFSSGNGYFTFTDTAIRVSGSYSRMVRYNKAFGIQDKLYDPISILSPISFEKIYKDLVKNYSKNDLKCVSLGDMTSVLYGDYSKKGMSRYNTQTSLENSFKNISENLGSILAQNANQYAFKYVDHITNIPLYSSRFDIFDKDIPFLQSVLHGIVPYSTSAINENSESEQFLLRAIALGSNLNFDMLHEETSELKDTDYDIYFYANYKNWVETAAAEYKFAKEILKDLGDKFISSYEEKGNTITTVYSDGTKIIVNISSGDIFVNDKKYNITDYIEEGGLIF